MAKLGGKINFSKTVVYYPSGVIPAAVRALGCRCVDSTTPLADRGYVQLGVPQGSAEFVRRHLAAVVQRTEEDCARICR
jgi:hypothetical protein